MSRTGAAFARGQSKQDYATPREFIDAVVSQFGALDFDLAATYENTVAPHFFGPPETKRGVRGGTHCRGIDAFTQDWTELSGNLWLNPPFDRIAPWAAKCAVSAEWMYEGCRPGECPRKIFFLVPAAVGSNWWASWVHERARVLFLNGRICFDGIAPYPKDCALIVYGMPPGYEIWRWKENEVA